MGDETRNFASSEFTIDRHIDMEVDSEEEEEEEEEEEDLKQDYLCPFCFEDFDLVGFCCHIDSVHPIEAKSGICPVCAKRVWINMSVHTITQHGSILKMMPIQMPRSPGEMKLRSGGSFSTLSLLRKHSENEHRATFVEESSPVVSSSNMTADPLLSSFIYNPTPADEPEILHSSSTTEGKLAGKSSDDSMSERNIHMSPLPNKDQEEKTLRCEFAQGLLYSTIFEDD